MGDVTNLRSEPPSGDAAALRIVDAYGLDGLRHGFSIPDYLTDDELEVAFRAWAVAGSLRLRAGTDGRQKVWDAVCQALSMALSHESPEEHAAYWAREREQGEAERFRDSIRPV